MKMVFIPILLSSLLVLSPLSGSSGQETASTSLSITVGDATFLVVLEDNASTQALREMLPMAVSMRELNGNELYGYLPMALPTAHEEVEQIQVGDLMLYGDNCLVLFYEGLPTSYRYTRLGSVSNPSGLAALLGSGEVRVTWEVA